jgi:uncharacterized protein (TIGR02597 family)
MYKLPILALLLITFGRCYGQTAITDAIGFVEVSCLPNSDTIVGVPLRTLDSIRSGLAAPPAVSGDAVSLTFPANSFVSGALNGHYVKFLDSNRAGRWYDIQTSANSGTPNTTNAVTISLNGDTIGSVTSGTKVLIARYWTLNELFPPTGATTTWSGSPAVPNGHAIVASQSTSASRRRTELLLPDRVRSGINLSPSAVYYITGNSWVHTQGSPGAGNVILWPDSYITIRQPVAVTQPTVYRSIGEVDISDSAIPLRTSSTGQQDNFIALLRPLDMRLDQLNLLEGGAFVSSGGTSIRNRKDVLLVFDNAVAARNRSASATYFHDGTNWRNTTNVNVTANTDIINSASGFIIRKSSTTTPSTLFWRNPPNY